jgi:CBS domain-containing protein
MHAKHVRDIMTPLEEYTIVSENDTLYNAFMALKKSKENLRPGQHTHRAVLVVDRDNKIVGKLGHLGFLKALEPKYKVMGDLDMISKAGLNTDFISSMMNDYDLWQDELDDVRSRSKNIKMKDVMRLTTENIDINASMNEAIHKIVMYQMISILVIENDKVVGLLRLTDVYDEVSRNILGD